MATQDDDKWTLTDDGLERDYYYIDASRLGERWQGSRHRDGDLLDWPLHIAGKSWSDYDDFERVFRQACATFPDKIAEPFDESVLNRSLDLGRAINEYKVKRAAAFEQIQKERGMGSLLLRSIVLEISDEVTRRVGPPPADIESLGL